MKTKLKSALFFLLIIFVSSASFAQLNTTTEKNTPREFAIPTSPLFDLMGVAPSQVARTAEIKDFKVDEPKIVFLGKNGA